MALFRNPARLRGALASSFLRRLHAGPPPKSGLDEAGPLACRLESRSVVRVRGSDTVKFLQGLLTNDVRRLADQDNPTGRGGESQTSYIPTPNLNHRSPPPLYAAFLTPREGFCSTSFSTAHLGQMGNSIEPARAPDRTILKSLLLCLLMSTLPSRMSF